MSKTMTAWPTPATPSISPELLLSVVEDARPLAATIAHDLNSALQILSDASFAMQSALPALSGASAEAVAEIKEASARANDAFARARQLVKTVGELVPPLSTGNVALRGEI